MKRANQTGSIGVFAVVGVILVVASLAVLYGIRQTNLSQNTSPISSDLVASDEKKDAATQNNQPNRKSSDGAEQKTDSHQSGRGEPRSETKAGEAKTKETTTPAGPSQSSPQSDKGLPQTGPESLIVSAIAIGFLTFLAVTYQRSRHLV